MKKAISLSLSLSLSNRLKNRFSARAVSPIANSHIPHSNSGFTIVELLVVIVVIGILAAITVVSYTGITSKANIAVLQSDLSNASQMLKVYQATYGSYPTALNGNYCPSLPTPDTTLCLKASGSNTFAYTSNGTTFGLTETNSSGMVYNITDSTVVAAGSLTTYYTLTISAGANGTVNTAINGSYASGSTPTITATPSGGYVFSSWSGSTGCSGTTTASYAITMDGDKTCTANFVIDPWADWYVGVGSLAGKYVYKTDASGTYTWSTGSPGSTAGCATGGYWPTKDELLSMYTEWNNRGRGTEPYGTFQATTYWSSTEQITVPSRTT